MNEIKLMLGGTDIDVELTPDELSFCVDLSLQKYRQRATNSTEESIAFLKLERDVQEYTLPAETLEVREIFRRGISTAADSTTTMYDPFTLAFTNIYLLQAGEGGAGIFTFELYNQYLETAGKMFGAIYNFTWDHRTKKLKVVRRQQTEEEVLLWVYNYVPDQFLLDDIYAQPWLRSWALAEAKIILGQKYEKFATLPSPQGGITLNGAQLKSEGVQEKIDLLTELGNLVDGSPGLGVIIG